MLEMMKKFSGEAGTELNGKKKKKKKSYVQVFCYNNYLYHQGMAGV